jgi:DNA-binding NarL/FixJ family response regulator
MGDRPGKLRVELVDDQALVRTALADLIQASEGMEIVATAGEMKEALRCAEEFKPSIVLMDVLSEPNVFEGAKTIMDRCPGTALIILDDAPVDANVREALRIGAAGYLTKQQPFGQIDAAVRQAARGDRVFTPSIARRLVLAADGVRLAADNRQDPLARLTQRETDVLINLTQGRSVKQCAEALGIGTSTVGNHKSRLMKKLNVHKTVELVYWAVREGMIPGGKSIAPSRLPRSRVTSAREGTSAQPRDNQTETCRR